MSHTYLCSFTLNARKITGGSKRNTSVTVHKRSCLVVTGKIFPKLEDSLSLLNCHGDTLGGIIRTFKVNLWSPSDVKEVSKAGFAIQILTSGCSPNFVLFLKATPSRKLDMVRFKS